MHKFNSESRCSDVLEHYQCQLCPFATHFHVEIRQHRKMCNLEIFSAINPIFEKDVCSMSLEPYQPYKFNSESRCSDVLEHYQCQLCPFGTHFRVEMHEHSKNCNWTKFSETKPAIEKEDEDSMPLDSTLLQDDLQDIGKIVTVRVGQYEEYIQNGGVIMSREDWEKAEKFYCAYCKYYSNVKRRVKQHMSRQHVKRLECSQCSYRTDVALYLRNHEIRHHGIQHDNVKWFKCTLCNYQATYKQSLVRHLKHRHNAANIQLILKCEHCDYETEDAINLTQHKSDKHTETRPSHAKTNRTDPVTRLSCQQCEYVAKRKYNLKAHMDRKHGEWEQLRCGQCDFTTTSQSKMKQHKKHLECKHVEQKQLLQCAQCDFTTTNQYYLKTHEEKKHTPDHQIKWHQCQHCDHKTKWATQLRNHIHSKHGMGGQIKWFQCNQCDYKCEQKVDLKPHTMSHHNV